MNQNYQLQPVQDAPVAPQSMTQSEPMALAYSLAETTYALAEYDAFRDKLKATLTKQTLDNVSALAATEAYYNQIAPGGRAEYRRIMEAYTDYASAMIREGGW